MKHLWQADNAKMETMAWKTIAKQLHALARQTTLTRGSGAAPPAAMASLRQRLRSRSGRNLRVCPELSDVAEVFNPLSSCKQPS
jgi:hypothetical protein